MMFTLTVMILVGVPCAVHAAFVATDLPGYVEGDNVTIFSAGWLPYESVSLVLSDNYFNVHYSSNVQADERGNIMVINAYQVQSGDEGLTFTLTATGSSDSAQVTFDDVTVLRLFKDASYNIQRNAFAWGATAYARAFDLTTNRCYKVEWIDPSNTIVETHYLAPGTSTRDDSFVVPATGPSGVWKAILYRANTTGSSCTSYGYSTVSPQINTNIPFDVAQIVVIGAEDGYILQQFPDLNTNSSSNVLINSHLDVNNDPNDMEKTFLRFSFTLPGNANVISAKVRMRVLFPPSFFSSRTYNINRITNAWDVNTITWNNPQATVASSPTDAQPTPTGLTAINSYMRWDVTSDVGSFPNSGWRIVDSAAQDPEGIFYSTEFNSLSDSELYGPVLLIDTQVVIPTMTEWGMIIFMILAGLGSVYYLRRRGRV